MAWASPCQCTFNPPGPCARISHRAVKKKKINTCPLLHLPSERGETTCQKLGFPSLPLPLPPSRDSPVSLVSRATERGVVPAGSISTGNSPDLHGPLPAWCEKKRAQGIRCALVQEKVGRTCKFDRRVDRQKAHVCPRAATYHSSELRGRGTNQKPPRRCCKPPGSTIIATGANLGVPSGSSFLIRAMWLS